VRNGYSEKTIKSQNGEHRIKVPRDRADDFDPVILPKHKCVSQELEECIILLYADGMNNSLFFLSNIRVDEQKRD